MSMRCSLVAVVGTLLLAPGLVQADGPGALWLEPSLKWHGIDGNWSSTTLYVGEPAQELDVVVSTSISEMWVVEDSGCGSPLCNDARGGVFNRNASKSWSPMGVWQLGLKTIGIQANGDYGMETVVVYDSVRRWQTSLNKLLVAGINDTAAYTGFFGLGITDGNFGGVVAQGPLASLVQQSGIIPSHSYGYTAGAYYAGTKGVPMSLTLGGYDSNRFEPHDVQFSLNATTRQPQVLIRGITASVSDVEQAPAEWPTSSMTLSAFNESMIAKIDSSTPYLWLPPAICDRFATALNLTWNETLGLYIFSNNDNLERYRSAPDLSFTFIFSSVDNKNNFGSPNNMPGVVNITVSANAFVQSLQYPFKNIIDYGAPAIPYFPLKRAEDGSQLTIGRSFLQEAYIITNYETERFSIHKALFPEKPLRDTSIQTIPASADSPYPGPAVSKTEDSHNINQNQIAGVVVGVCVGAIALATTVVLLRRRRRSFKDDGNQNKMTDYKENYSATEPESPISPSAMTLFRAKTRAKKCQNKAGKQEGQIAAHEVAADRSHERYEMPAPLPVELDATDTTTSAYFTVPAGEDTHSQDSYNRPQQWAQPSLQPGVSGAIPGPLHADNRTAHIPPPINTRYRDSPSPKSSPVHEYDMNRMPSPVTPPSDGFTYFGDYPSPIGGIFPARTLSSSTAPVPTIIDTPPSPTRVNNSADLVRSESSAAPISSQAAISLPAQSLIQRTPIDSTHVVCLGPLPDNVRLPHQLMIRRPPEVQSHDYVSSIMPSIPPQHHSRRQSTADTLGSNFTLEEEARVAATHQGNQGTSAVGRIDGLDIVHVPQMAHQRYSWEQER